MKRIDEVTHTALESVRGLGVGLTSSLREDLRLIFTMVYDAGKQDGRATERKAQAKKHKAKSRRAK